jgi:hypothetical protein
MATIAEHHNGELEHLRGHLSYLTRTDRSDQLALSLG